MILRALCLLVATTSLLHTGLSSAASIQADCPALAREAGKSVVNISALRTVSPRDRLKEFFRRQGPGFPLDDLLDRFEERFQRDFGQEGTPGSRQESLGSGFIISADGHIVTNNHLVAGAEEIAVLLLGESEPRRAAIVGLDPETDLALIKIDAGRPLPALTFTDSDRSRVGEWVLAIGNPFGLDHSVTLGIISAKGRSLGFGPFDDFIQTDAPINPGNSGGPLIDLDGTVVGVNTVITASGQGISFAISSNTARRVIGELKTSGRVVRGWLGVSAQDVDVHAAKALGLSAPRGALVASLVPGAPAAQAGIKVGDVILRLDGKDIADSASLLRAVADYPPGRCAKIVVWRAGSSRILPMVIGRQEPEPNIPRPKNHEGASATEGLTLKPITDAEASQLDLDTGQALLVLNVEEDSPAERAGVLPGDCIVQAASKPVCSLKEFRSIVSQSRQGVGVVMLLLKRGGRNLFVTLDLR